MNVCPGRTLVEEVLKSWDSPHGMPIVWLAGLGRFPMRGELLNDIGNQRIYSVSLGTLLRFLAKAHDEFDKQSVSHLPSMTDSTTEEPT